MAWPFLPGCARAPDDAPKSWEPPASDAAVADEPIQPLPLESEFDPALAELGEELFKSTILSNDGRASCSSCHAADHGLADRTPFSELPGRPKTLTNSPSLFNVRYFSKLNWSGRFDTLEAHLDALLENPKVMATSWRNVVDRLNADPAWQARFRTAFADGVSAPNARRALVEYERSLVTPNAPFDRWLRGDAAAISAEARRGYELFKDYGCASCHQGRAVGGNMLQRFGVMRDYFSDHPDVEEGDLGRFNVTRRDEDRYVFRVPSLRNVALTAPYFHDGSAATLDVAIGVMARYQLGRALPEKHAALITEFLKSLTGEYRGRPL